MFPVLVAGSQKEYQIERSLRFRSAYLNRTPAVAGSQTTWTYSCWVKRGLLTTPNLNLLLMAGSLVANYAWLGILDTDQLHFGVVNASTLVAQKISTAVFRDPAAWYHFVVVWNTTNTITADRMRLYVNGVRITSFSTSVDPVANTTSVINSTDRHTVGTNSVYFPNSQLFDGYLAEFNFVDGQALTADSFGEFDTDTGIWKPKRYTGSYGTAGYYLKFNDTSEATATALTKDYSGNNNNWTPNGISLTSGATYDSMIDTPTPYPDGGNNRGNYATWNPLSIRGTNATTATLSNGNMRVTTASASGDGAAGTQSVNQPAGQKWYWEITVVSGATTAANAVATGIWVYGGDNTFGPNFTYFSSDTPTYTNGDTISFAYDGTTSTLYCYKNNVLAKTITSANSTLPLFPFFRDNIVNASVVADVNFGQQPFKYPIPSGYKTMNTYNLPEPTIVKSNQHFKTTLWTGLDSGPSRSFTGVGFAPDLAVTKNRSSPYATIWYDRVRGVGAGKALSTFTTDPENTLNTTQFGFLSAFGADGTTWTRGSAGATAGKPDGYAYYDQLNNAYVSWNWKANGATTVTNTAGTIQSQVSVNPTAGFSIVTYTGNGVNGATIGHGLGVAPDVIICHNLDVTSNWRMYHTSLPVTVDIILNSTNAKDSAGQFPVRPTSQVWTVTGSGGPATNGTGNRQLAYCFSEVAGYSKFSSYIGNGLADGPFVYCGFRPAWIMFKDSTTAVTDWKIHDTSRSPYNMSTNSLAANSANAELIYSAGGLDILSNGFKVRVAGSPLNISGATIIFLAFAENPFKYSLAR